ncbi:efflux RND transporter permease subunit [Clostridium algidicarnis]|uniref:efflux RND transporter permease subunit n=1 Tax=Clostridium algidicarnis TaxID=37659 RepID=UPI001C0E1F53|nr:MMPL family transporter [Clostridium algidicarnis]MBU3196180.1 MMPL family transporter [Clostridium algidicarnis]MBU3209222.1 MMPL family transporter [Clostridium algidicarnis]MBU3228871.1 MMPL family transporter [Clostridium algidicarnis]MBU3252411.1 MMPL family transporter [Clostridium algidicarnis]
MKKFGEFIAKHRNIVLIVAVLLSIISVFGMVNTKINYDVLTYLPQELDSMKGQNILDDTFASASLSMLIMDDAEPKEVSRIKEKIQTIEGVDSVLWIDDALDISIPKEILPEDVKKALYSGDSTMMVIKYKEGSSSEVTQNAITDIRKVMDEKSFLSGVSAIVKDTKDLSDKQTPIYVLIAVILSTIVLALTMESVIIPFIFLASIGFAILYNFGSNIFLGEVSYITKALAAVLQLGVTMDYSIFLLHRYEEEKLKIEDKQEAMAEAIANTITAISGSSLTTIAGFLALCVMELALGKDIGIVMAKGVLLGVICTVTILPALVLYFDKAIHKFKHKTILPEFTKVADYVTNHYKFIVTIFVIAFIPAIYGANNAKVYYNLDESLPKDMESVVALNKLKEDYNMTTTHMIVVKDDLPQYKKKEMADRIEKVDGIEKVLSYDKLVGGSIPESFVPEDIKSNFKKDGYNLIVANSIYKAAQDEENAQVDEIINIAKEYDEDAMVSGEGPLTKDLIRIAESDFKRVNVVSILAIFTIIFGVFLSFSLPFILVLSIELAIFINLGIPYYTGTALPFISNIVIGTIQLGATVDYAILLTSRFKEEIANGYDKIEAMKISVQGSAKSIVTSALTFFAATAGVALISDMELIKSLCFLMARGALISMVVIIFILPSILIVSEKFIGLTTKGWGQKKKPNEDVKLSA